MKNKRIMPLYNKLVRYNKMSELNEMARRIDHRTISRGLWLSVASTISRSPDEGRSAKFRMSMADSALERYVSALLIKNKPCPETPEDIEEIGTYKEFGNYLVNHGTTFELIRELYNLNAGPVLDNANVVTPHTTVLRRPVLDMPRAINNPVNSNILMYKNKLNQIIQNVDGDDYGYDHMLGVNTHIENCRVWRACRDNIIRFINTLLKRSNGDIDTFVNFVQTIYTEFFKLCGVNVNKYTQLINILYILGTYRDNIKVFEFIVTPMSYSSSVKELNMANRYILKDFQNKRYQRYIHTTTYEDTGWLTNVTNYIVDTPINPRNDKRQISMIRLLTTHFFTNIIKPYCDTLEHLQAFIEED